MNKKVNANHIIDALELPQDVLLGASMISVTGDEEIFIENFKNIIEYCENSLLIQCKRYQIQIVGKKLWVEVYSKEEMKVKGMISEIRFLGRKRDVS